MIGAIIGDIVGSRFEFHNRLTKEFRFFTEECEFTDDTVMSVAVAESLMRCDGDYAELAGTATETLREIGQQYPYCGYGGRFINWMFEDVPRPYNSFGNGSAMRISAVGNLAQTVEEAQDLSRKVTAISHDHPEGLKGAECTAVVMVLAKQGMSKANIRKYVEEHYYRLGMTVADYRKAWHGHGDETCQVSLPQALVCFFEGEDFEDVIRNCISIGGDSDTLGAIAGAMAEAYFGVPEWMKEKAYGYLDDQLAGIVKKFEETYGAHKGNVLGK